MLSKYEKYRHDEEIINTRNELFDSYHKQQILGGSKINFTNLALLLGKDRKTVRKYFNARIQKRKSSMVIKIKDQITLSMIGFVKNTSMKLINWYLRHQYF